MSDSAQRQAESDSPDPQRRPATGSLLEFRLLRGLRAHQEGELAEARRQYDNVLQSDPDHATTLHLLGVLNMQEGRIDDAVRMMQKSVAIAPDVAEVHSNLAGALNRQQRSAEAITASRRAIDLRPDLATAHFNLGNALTQTGALDQAIAAYRATLEHQPAYPEACFNLGNALQQNGQLEEAVAAYNTAIALRAGHAESYGNLAQALIGLERAPEAETNAREAIFRRPDFAEAYDTLGRALDLQDRLEEAAEAFERALSLQPGLAAARHHLEDMQQRARKSADVISMAAASPMSDDDWQATLARGDTLFGQGEFDEAAAAYRRAVTARPDRVDACVKLSDAYLALADCDRAIAALREAISIAPEDAVVHDRLAHVLRIVGELDEAGKAWQRAVELKPDFGSAHRMLAELNHFNGGENDIAAIEVQLSDPAIDPGEAANLCFAITKAYEDIGQYDRAFAFLDQANRLKRATQGYDPAYQQEVVARATEVFTQSFLEATSGRGCADARPVFVVGMPRSGTTLVEQILASHSHVHGAGENSALAQAVDDMFDSVGLPAALDAVPRATTAMLQQVGRTYIDNVLPANFKGRRCVDRTASNYLYVGFIHLVLPNAMIIHCRRNAADTCLACYRTAFTDGQHAFAYSLADLGAYYRLYDDLMRHWHTVLPGRILDVRYEDIVADQEAETRRLLDHCGLPWENACMTFFEAERPVLSHAATDVRQPIYPDGLRRWKRYERHLGPLFEAFDPLVD